VSPGGALFTLLVLLMPSQPRWLAAVEEPSAQPLETSTTVTVRGGRFRPLYAPSPTQKEVNVAPFSIDRDPVTNAEFLAFVKQFPKYRRDRISALFADSGYLAHWAGPTELGSEAKPEQPVVRISWFAANAFCEAVGKRLPTELEWEYVASASETSPDARRDAAWREKILSWYARPATDTLPVVGKSRPNYYGVRDLHGLVWEWVLDYNSLLVSSDSRGSGRDDRVDFCGAGSIGSGDGGDYASFMRSAFRSSLRSDYTTQSLGFRCATSEKEAT